MKKKILSILMITLMVLTLFAGNITTVNADGTEISGSSNYLLVEGAYSKRGELVTYASLSSSDALTALVTENGYQGWYSGSTLIDNVQIKGATINGDVKIILKGGKSLEFTDTVTINEGQTLTIYKAESSQTATLKFAAGIKNNGTLIINGGEVEICCDDSGKDIQGSGTTIINGGHVTFAAGTPNYAVDSTQTIEVSKNLQLYVGNVSKNKDDLTVVKDREEDVSATLSSNRFAEIVMPIAITISSYANGSVENGTVSLTGALSTADGYAAFEGDEVTIVPTPNENCEFDDLRVILDDGSWKTVSTDASYKFTMPGQSVRIQADFDPPKTKYIEPEIEDYEDFSKGISFLLERKSSWSAIESSDSDVVLDDSVMVNGDVTINGNLTINSEVDILVCDGSTLTINGSIIINEHSVLYIWGQKNQTGVININAKNNSAAISGRSVMINGAVINAVGNNASALDLKMFSMSFGTLNAQGGEGYDALDIDEEIPIYGDSILKADNNYPAETIITVDKADMKADIAGKQYVNISPKEFYEVSLEYNENRGSVEISKNPVVEGKEVKITATANDDYMLSEILVYKTGDENTKVELKDNTFIMPGYPVTVEVVFVEKPLTFTALENNSTVKLSFIPDLEYDAAGEQYIANHEVEYRTGSDDEWGDWTAYTSDDLITLAQVGDKVQFRGENVKTSNYSHFIMTGKIQGSGNVLSLIDKDGGNTDISLHKGCFSYMFYECESLIEAPNVMVDALPEEACYAMFSGCANLTATGKLTATSIDKNAYKEMFSDCTELVKVSSIKIETIADGAMSAMFKGCKKLEVAEAEEKDANLIIPSLAEVTDATKGMFDSTKSELVNIVEGTYSVVRATVKSTDFTVAVSNSTYDGKFKTATVSTELKTGTEIASYEVLYYKGETKLESAPVDAGTYTIKINVVGNDQTLYESKEGLTDASWTFTIGKKAVTLTSGSGNKTYDGTALVNKTVDATGFIDGEGVESYNVTGTRTDAGTSKNTFTYVLKNNTKADNYEITTVEGTLTVGKKAVTITSASGSKTYDGKALVNKTVTATGFVDGEGLESYQVTGERTASGTSKNTFTYVLKSNTKADNYEITVEEGTLTVEADPNKKENQKEDQKTDVTQKEDQKTDETQTEDQKTDETQTEDQKTDESKTEDQKKQDTQKEDQNTDVSQEEETSQFPIMLIIIIGAVAIAIVVIYIIKKRK